MTIIVCTSYYPAILLFFKRFCLCITIPRHVQCSYRLSDQTASSSSCFFTQTYTRNIYTNSSSLHQRCNQWHILWKLTKHSGSSLNCNYRKKLPQIWNVELERKLKAICLTSCRTNCSRTRFSFWQHKERKSAGPIGYYIKNSYRTTNSSQISKLRKRFNEKRKDNLERQQRMRCQRFLVHSYLRTASGKKKDKRVQGVTSEWNLTRLSFAYATSKQQFYPHL